LKAALYRLKIYILGIILQYWEQFVRYTCFKALKMNRFVMAH